MCSGGEVQRDSAGSEVQRDSTGSDAQRDSSGSYGPGEGCGWRHVQRGGSGMGVGQAPDFTLAPMDGLRGGPPYILRSSATATAAATAVGGTAPR